MEEAVIKRIMPHSEEAEQSVVGSMLMDKDAILVASEIITGADFYAKQYGIVFDACVELYNEGKPVDLITLQDRLREKDVPPEVSRLEFVRELLTSVPTSANVKYLSLIHISQASDRWRRYTKIKETRNESRRAGRIASTKTPDKYRRICKAEETCFAGRKEVRQEAPQKKETADGHVESGASACGHRGILFFGIFADPHWAEL